MKFSYIIMGIAIVSAILGEYIFDFYYENLIIMAMLVAIFLKKEEV